MPRLSNNAMTYYHTKLTDGQVKDICTEYINGRSSLSLGSGYGVSDETILRVLKQNNIERRVRGGGISIEERFKKFVREGDINNCCIWVGYCHPNGYGQFHDINGNPVYAHRFAWELANGPVPRGLCVLHKCDNPSCVNVKHLFLGTNSDNSIDMAIKCRGVSSKRGLAFGAKPTESGRYASRVTVNMKQLHLCMYDTEKEASDIAMSIKLDRTRL